MREIMRRDSWVWMYKCFKQQLCSPQDAAQCDPEKSLACPAINRRSPLFSSKIWAHSSSTSFSLATSPPVLKCTNLSNQIDEQNTLNMDVWMSLCYYLYQELLFPSKTVIKKVLWDFHLQGHFCRFCFVSSHLLTCHHVLLKLLSTCCWIH